MTIKLDVYRLGDFLNLGQDQFDPEALCICSPFQLKRRGIEAKIVSGATLKSPDQKLIAVLAKAHQWLDEIKAGRSMYELSLKEGRSEDYVRSRIELAFLSPKLQ